MILHIQGVVGWAVNNKIPGQIFPITMLAFVSLIFFFLSINHRIYSPVDCSFCCWQISWI